MLKILKKADAILAKVLLWLVVVMCIGIGVILFARVIIRFAHIPFPMAWSDEVVACMMAWMIFSGATLLFRAKDHFRVDLLQDKFKGKRWLSALNVLITLTGIAFFAALLYYSILLVQSADWPQPILKFSTRLPYSSMPVNCFLILLYLIRDIVTEIKELVARRSPAAAMDEKSEPV
jgi:TRAP-type C4-dicarboxylate transport system permease small subunit